MPKVAIDYSKTIIYKIVCNDTTITDCYVGRTIDFRKRKWHHKSDCNNENGIHYNFKLYQVIRANGGWENWSMVPLEECNCENQIQAQIKEREWFDKLKANLNVDTPNTTPSEAQKKYCENNKDKRKETCRKYIEKNKDKINEKYNKKFICECGKKYTYINKSRHELSKKHLEFINLNNLSIDNINGAN